MITKERKSIQCTVTDSFSAHFQTQKLIVLSDNLLYTYIIKIKDMLNSDW